MRRFRRRATTTLPGLVAVLGVLAAAGAGCTNESESGRAPPHEWRLVYQNSLDGRPIAGSVDELIGAVVVQFPPSFIQTSYTDVGETYLQTDPPTVWRALMSTDGTYHQFHYDLRTGEITRAMYARTQMSWFALSAPRGGESVGESDGELPDLTPRDAFRLDSVVTP